MEPNICSSIWYILKTKIFNSIQFDHRTKLNQTAITPRWNIQVGEVLEFCKQFLQWLDVIPRAKRKRD